MKLVVLALLSLLVGCASGVVDSNPRSVVVRMGHAYPGEAAKMAQAECQKYGRSARLNQRDPDAPIWHFDCL